MSALLKMASAPLTMSSREIAKLTGKDLAHVHRDIRSMLDQLVDDPELDHVREDKDARSYTACFHLTKSLSMTLVAGYNVRLRKAIIDRWMELEAMVEQPRIPRTLPEALRLAADESERADRAEAVLALATPKADAFDRIAASDGSLCLTDAAKTLKVPPRQFIQTLVVLGWIYRRPMGSNWLGYQDKINSGHLEHRATTIERKSMPDWSNTQVRVTAKGLTRLAKMMGSSGVVDHTQASTPT